MPAMAKDSLGMSSPAGMGLRYRAQGVEHVTVRRVLSRVLEFTRFTIDDVVNDPVAKNAVRGYFKLHRWVEREGETLSLERQWNPLGRR